MSRICLGTWKVHLLETMEMSKYRQMARTTEGNGPESDVQEGLSVMWESDDYQVISK